jgi:hypothetical protein
MHATRRAAAYIYDKSIEGRRVDRRSARAPVRCQRRLVTAVKATRSARMRRSYRAPR